MIAAETLDGIYNRLDDSCWNYRLNKKLAVKMIQIKSKQ